ncbi:uncharacterized protein H6S33_000752 [Morchella sextelata]|uniref:uncharacterized protein n=1 Tax=Morchella sextelata TaxID=1174677 RepID=UPI001D04DCF2|nr:uncharacterized protein H6S33_000752 [Morchella sextelata]KAH0615116.1 hypothetical protein H6S33_000752 [Morchella sextelata]
MSFAISSSNVRIEERDGHTYLHADARDEDGNENGTQLNLDECLGNNEGSFNWSGEGFTGSAENIHLSIEGPEQLPILRAQLRDSEGNTHDRDVNLSERIVNDNGCLVFQ